MPFWSKKDKGKGKETASRFDPSPAFDGLLNPGFDSITGEQLDPHILNEDGRLMLMPPYRNTSVPREKDKIENVESWDALKKYWEEEAERRRMRVAKVEEAQGKCSLEHMAAVEAAIEAFNMYMETDWTPGKTRTVTMRQNEEQQVLQAFEERGEYFVPASILRSSLDTVMDIHATCCCGKVKRDPMYIQNNRTGSFRGPTPIRRDIDSLQRAGPSNTKDEKWESDVKEDQLHVPGVLNEHVSWSEEVQELLSEIEGDEPDAPAYDMPKGTTSLSRVVNDALPTYIEATNVTGASSK